SMLCGLSFEASLPSTASDTSRHSAPALSPHSTSPRATPLAAEPARQTSVSGTKPLSRAVIRIEAPSATNSPVSLRTLRISSARIALTRSFCRLVMGFGPGSTGIADPPREEGRRQGARSCTLFADRELTRLEAATARTHHLAAELVEGERGGTDRVDR